MGAEDPVVAKAANTIRRVIQKVRLATPENFDELEGELLETMERHIPDLGDKFDALQDAADKGLALARKRVETLLAKREKEAAALERPRELLRELDQLINSFEEKALELKAAVGIEETGVNLKEVKLNTEDAQAVDSLLKQFDEHKSSFAKSYAEFVKGNLATLRAPTLPAELKAEYDKLVQKVTTVQKDALFAVAAAKESVKTALEKEKKERLERAKMELKDKLREASHPVLAAEEAVEKAEKEVEPFAKVKSDRSVEEMLALAKAADTSISLAQEAVKDAHGHFELPESDESDELINAELKSWLQAEAKRPELRLGQMERRLSRATQLLRLYRRFANKERFDELFKELEPQVVEKAKAAAANTSIISQVEVAIKDAEKCVEPFAKAVKMSLSEGESMAEEAATAVEGARLAFVEARKELRPIDEGLDEDIVKKLTEVIVPLVKRAELRLNSMERRITRASNLLAAFRSQAQKRAAERVKEVRPVALRIMAQVRDSRQISHDELFADFDADSSGAIDEAEFVSFFDIAASERPADQALELSEADVKSLFDSCSKDGVISKDTFMELAGAYMKVVKVTPLTAELSVTGSSRALRQLRLNEVLEVLEGPKQDGSAGILRVKAQPLPAKTGVQGWVTMVSTAGTVFLKACTADEVAKAKK
mmetsp:Transcript_92107/g.214079  ORF Transcript_92107/g.214079 Transcript_92107/m.214079 type:complete len:658 (-) Transcript_92107:85-2058(-)